MDEPTHSEPAPAPVYLTAQISGVVLPAWLAACLGAAALLSAIALVMAIVLFRDSARDNAKTTADALHEVSKEIRLLQLNMVDVRTVLIERGLAKPSDFAPVYPPPENPKAPKED